MSTGTGIEYVAPPLTPGVEEKCGRSVLDICKELGISEPSGVALNKGELGHGSSEPGAEMLSVLHEASRNATPGLGTGL